MGITAAQKKAIEEVMEILLKAQGFRPKRQLAGMFLELVDRDDWKDYYENKYKDALDVYTDLSLVFLNALFYNEPDSQIAADAQTLKTSPDTARIPSADLGTESTRTEAKKDAPQPQPTPAPKLNPPAAAPTPTVPQPSTSTFVYSKPIPIHPAPAVVSPVAPPHPSSPSPSRNLKRRTGRTTNTTPRPARHRYSNRADGGWMADVKHDRHLEIMQAIKAYREANVKLSAALEPGIPEDKLTISFRLLESRSRSKTFYTSSAPFDADVARMFENARRYYLERCNSVAGVSGDEWSRVVALQRIAHVLTSPHAPSLPLAEPIVIPPPLRSPGAHALDSVMHKGFVLRPKDYVHVVSGAEAEGETMGRPFMGRITACWRDDAARGYIHLMPTRSTGPIQGEVIQTDKITHHPVLDVIERVACQHTSAASRGRPRAPAWYPGWPLYVCAHRYDAVRARVRRILRAEWYNNDSAEGNGSDAPLDLFERPVRLGGHQKKQGAVVDRSVVTAGGVAVSAVDKLGPETTRHFERDPTTGEVLWFPGPPLHVARAPPPGIGWST
ncbi:hypothetical protein B0H14DRAFT_3633665 [Mycena olivaceomarginata]|nr:hypothetical protein B0H14DRAFT_3633665 [Mycena olivaceomarginata]